jgi:uncharacterized BrkB/YihY/UPF0761 family membrane protein
MKELIKDVSDFAVLFFGIATLLILFVTMLLVCFAPVGLGMWVEEIVGSGLGICSMMMLYCVYYVVAKRMGWIEKYMEVLNG